MGAKRPMSGGISKEKQKQFGKKKTHTHAQTNEKKIK